MPQLMICGPLKSPLSLFPFCLYYLTFIIDGVNKNRPGPIILLTSPLLFNAMTIFYRINYALFVHKVDRIKMLLYNATGYRLALWVRSSGNAQFESLIADEIQWII